MYFAAIFLLVVCVWDLIRAFTLINKSRKKAGIQWSWVMRQQAFAHYAFSVVVNLVAIWFFSVYLFL
jgi:hypothetical protein